MATFVLPNMNRFKYEVHEGELDFALVRPVDSQLFVSTRQISFWNAVDIVVGAVVLSWALTGLGGRIGAGEVALFALGLFCGATIICSVWLAFTTSAFRLIDIGDLDTIMNSLYDAARWPIRIYPFWLQGTLTAVVPLGVAITVPAEALTGRASVSSVVVLVVVTIGGLVGARAFWKLGIRVYSGASA